MKRKINNKILQARIARKKLLREQMAQKGFFTITALAEKIKCSAWSIHTFNNEPDRLPNVRDRIREVLDV